MSTGASSRPLARAAARAGAGGAAGFRAVVAADAGGPLVLAELSALRVPGARAAFAGLEAIAGIPGRRTTQAVRVPGGGGAWDVRAGVGVGAAGRVLDTRPAAAGVVGLA